MITDTLTNPVTLAELIRYGRERLDQEKALLERDEKERQLATQKSQEAVLELILEQLPEAVHQYAALGGGAPRGGVWLYISLPDCDQIRSSWRFSIQEGIAEQVGKYEVPEFAFTSWEEFPALAGSMYFDLLEDALAYAVEQGPTYASAEQKIADRLEKMVPELTETSLQEELKAALEHGAETSMSTNADYRLLAVLAQAVVSIADSQKAIANNLSGI